MGARQPRQHRAHGLVDGIEVGQGGTDERQGLIEPADFRSMLPGGGGVLQQAADGLVADGMLQREHIRGRGGRGQDGRERRAGDGIRLLTGMRTGMRLIDAARRGCAILPDVHSFRWHDNWPLYEHNSIGAGRCQ
ncbi:MAG: hypothetical protein ACYCZF_17930 [Anaerolineae bacterium]